MLRPDLQRWKEDRFTSIRNGDLDIYTMDADGTKRKDN